MRDWLVRWQLQTALKNKGLANAKRSVKGEAVGQACQAAISKLQRVLALPPRDQGHKPNIARTIAQIEAGMPRYQEAYRTWGDTFKQSPH